MSKKIEESKLIKDLSREVKKDIIRSSGIASDFLRPDQLDPVVRALVSKIHKQNNQTTKDFDERFGEVIKDFKELSSTVTESIKALSKSKSVEDSLIQKSIKQLGDSYNKRLTELSTILNERIESSIDLSEEDSTKKLTRIQTEVESIISMLNEYARKSDLPPTVEVVGGSNITVIKTSDSNNNRIRYKVNSKTGFGSIVSLGGGVTDDSITNARLSDMPANTIKARNANTAGDPQDVGVNDLTEEGGPASGHMLVGFVSGELRKFDIGNLPGGGGGEANTGSNIGVSGIGVFDSKVGVNLRFKNITSLSPNISVVAGASGTIDVGASGLLDTDTTTNDIIEGASGLYYSAQRFNTAFSTKDTNDLSEGASNFYYTQARFNTSLATKTTNDLTEGVSNFYYRTNRFVGTGGASVSVNGLTLSIFVPSGAGEANTASNIGTSGIGVFDNKDGVDLEFRNITGQSQYFGVALDGANINLTLKPTAIDHGGLQGLGDDDHTAYHTDARALTWLGTRTANDLPVGVSNFYYTESLFDSSFSGKDSNDLVEGASNFYYTQARFDTSLGNKTTNDLTEGSSGLYYSAQRFNTAFSSKDTNDLTEGASNFYYTQSRFDTSLGTKTSNNLTEGSSALYYSQQRFNSAFTAKNTDDLTQGSVNFYNQTHTGDATGNTLLTIPNGTVTYAKMQDVSATDRILGRDTAGAGDIEEITPTAVKTMLSLDNVDNLSVRGATALWDLRSKAFLLIAPVATDDLPIIRFDANVDLVKTVYAVSGGTNWTGQLQTATDARGSSAANTQASDSGVTATTTVTSFSGSTFMAGDYAFLKTTSVGGGVSWLHVTMYYNLR